MSRNRTVRKYEALELVGEMEVELLQEAARAAQEGRVPTAPYAFKEWNERRELKLGLLRFLREQVEKQDALDVVAEAEGTA